MRDIMMALLAIGCNLIVFFLCGAFFLRIIKEKISLLWALITGFFVFFGVYTLVYLPCMLLQTSFVFMMILTSSIVLIVCIFSVKITYQEVRNLLKGFSQRQISVLQCTVIIVTGICFIALIVYSVRSTYMGYDTAYYAKVTGEALNENVMYTGYGVTNIEFRYALSPFYMYAAANAKMFGLHHLTCLKVVMGGLCNIYAGIIVVFILKRLIKRVELVCLGIAIWILGMFAFNGIYNQAGFLLFRSYEGKAYCSNIILPLLVFLIFMLWKGSEQTLIRKMIVLISVTADVISMSCLITVPAALLCGFVPLIIVDKQKRDVKTLMVSLLCSFAFLVSYLLMDKYVVISAY